MPGDDAGFLAKRGEEGAFLPLFPLALVVLAPFVLDLSRER